MKTVVVFFLVLNCFVRISFGQKIFSGSQEEYIIKISEDVTTKSVEKEDGGYVDYYILRENDSFVYMLSITHVNLGSANTEMIYSNDYKKSYLSECGCTIKDDRPVEYENLIGREFEIQTELNDKSVRGYSVATFKSGVLYNINFFALDERFESSKSDYQKMLNSIAFK